MQQIYIHKPVNAGVVKSILIKITKINKYGKTPLDSYKYLMDNLYNANGPTNVSYQTEYTRFYKVIHRTLPFINDYFLLLENKKSSSVTFQDVFTDIYNLPTNAAPRKREISFASKLLHTINPSYPIWDSIVAEKHFGYKLPSDKSSGANPIPACCDVYAQYHKAFDDYMNSPDGQKIICAFDDYCLQNNLVQYFPKNGLSNVKKLDFVLWLDK